MNQKAQSHAAKMRKRNVEAKARWVRERDPKGSFRSKYRYHQAPGMPWNQECEMTLYLCDSVKKFLGWI